MEMQLAAGGVSERKMKEGVSGEADKYHPWKRRGRGRERGEASAGGEDGPCPHVHEVRPGRRGTSWT